MRKSKTSKSEAMVLSQKRVESLPVVWNKLLPKVEEFKYFGVYEWGDGGGGDWQAD